LRIHNVATILHASLTLPIPVGRWSVAVVIKILTPPLPVILVIIRSYVASHYLKHANSI